MAASGLTKKELLVLAREKDKLEKTLGGIRDMQKVPSAVWIVDTKKEHIAVGEARKLRIPVVAILDTNCDPDEVDYKIPGNDDAIRSVTLLTRVIADAVAEGLIARSGAATGDAKAEPAPAEPLAEWERELLEGEKAKSDEAAPAAEAAAEAPAETEAAAEAPVEAAAETEVAAEAEAGRRGRPRPDGRGRGRAGLRPHRPRTATTAGDGPTCPAPAVHRGPTGSSGRAHRQTPPDFEKRLQSHGELHRR